MSKGRATRRGVARGGGGVKKIGTFSKIRERKGLREGGGFGGKMAGRGGECDIWEKGETEGSPPGEREREREREREEFSSITKGYKKG